MNKSIFGAITAVFAAFSLSVAAQEASKTGEMGHKSHGEMGHKSHHDKGMRLGAMMDTNADGSISRDEAMSFHTQMFAKLDLNGDGSIDAAEQAKMRETMREMKQKMKQH